MSTLHSQSLQSEGFSKSQAHALALLRETTDNVFLTGAAGTGKSFVIRRFLTGGETKKFPLLASTGAAAILIGGRTFHSFFGLGILEGGSNATLNRALSDTRLARRLNSIHGFVLDEVSMISGMALATAELICRSLRSRDEPWGGLRVIASGDFAQLPPVSPMGKSKDWAFLNSVWERSNLTPLVLTESFRSQDEEFMRILHSVRMGDITEEVRTYLNQRTDEEWNDPSIPHLFARRHVTESLNLQRLQEIEAPLHEFATDYSGHPSAIQKIKTQMPIPENLCLKKSALVMIRINDPQMRYINGTLGSIDDITRDAVYVTLKNQTIVPIERHLFTLLDAEGKPAANALNFPLTLAYATTIHKSQGMTLDSMITDLSDLWEPGQAYVALSRLRSGDGLRLRGWKPSSFLTDPAVQSFHRSLASVPE